MKTGAAAAAAPESRGSLVDAAGQVVFTRVWSEGDTEDKRVDFEGIAVEVVAGKLNSVVGSPRQRSQRRSGCR